MSQQVYPLQGAIQYYAWGGYHYLPDLLGIENKNHMPHAELWMGAHHRGPAAILKNEHARPLDELLEEYPEWLGEAVRGRFGDRLPYLFKVLDVREMLSIQAHPTKAQAELGFEKENRKGIPLDAPHRNFKDDNHKPEVMVALTEFWLLHGFKNEEAIDEVLRHVSELAPLKPFFADRNIFKLYRQAMEMPVEEVDAILRPLEQRLRQEESFLKSSPEYWALRAFDSHMLKDGHYDRGVFSIFLFNLVGLKPGEGIYQGAGVPHAYLEGVNVELMANSDNVFRGGLTAKHIDVEELLHHLSFEPLEPKVLAGERISAVEWAYHTPAPDFQLNKILLSEGEFYQSRPPDGPEIVLVVEGAVSSVGERAFTRGQAFFVPAGRPYALRCEQDSLLFKATTPV